MTAAPPATGDTWLGLSAEVLPTDAALAWTRLPSCGGQVMFCGTVRDSAEGRTDVVALEYEAYEEQALARMAALADEIRRRWPVVGRIAMLHRVGRLELCDVAVVVVVSAPHRGEAFAAGEFGIDTLKATVPIWKKEIWADGSDWGTNAVPIEEIPT